MAKRKTIQVTKVKTLANEMLNSSKLNQDQKSVLCTMVEKVLMDTGNYKGFGNNYWWDKGFDEWKAAG